MTILQDEQLAKYTTVKVGGIARNFYIPDTREELVDTLNSLAGETYYLLGGGSNLLINDKKIFTHVISLA
jgi:UDP-N-acetylmuramate dehydrogenase